MISTSGLNYALTLVTALGCGTIAGVFFAFSTFVMKALARLPPEEGIAAMQSINVFAINSWFLVAFLGNRRFLCRHYDRRSRPMERAVRHLPGAGWSDLFGGLFRRYDALQCANERGSGGTPANRARPSRPLGELRQRLDNVEPRAHRRLSLGGRVAGDRAEQNRLNSHFVVVTASSASGVM